MSVPLGIPLIFGVFGLGAAFGLYGSFDENVPTLHESPAIVTEKFGTNSFPYQACFYLEAPKQTACADFSGETWSTLRTGDRITTHYKVGRFSGRAFIA